MALDVARSWLGFSARWLGPARTSITGVSEVALPVVVVGHDACDGGGMTAASARTTLAVGIEYLRVRLTSGRGFALWSVRCASAAGATDRLLSLRTRDPTPFTGTPVAVQTWTPLRDVVVSASAEPTPPPLGLFSFPIAGGGAINLIELGRPMLIGPGETLDLWPNGSAGDAHLTVLFEEGL